MAIDTTAIMDSLTQGQLAAVAVAVAFAGAWWAVKAAKLLRDDGESDGDGGDDEVCAACGTFADPEELEGNGWICQSCYDEGLRLCRRCGDAICEDPEYPICPSCER